MCLGQGYFKYGKADPDYRQVVDGAMFSICDSGYVPLYLRWIYGIERHQYCGSDFYGYCPYEAI